MAKRKEPYITIPCTFIENLKNKKMIAKIGKAATFDYLMILAKHREFEETDFMIPDEMIPYLAQSLGTEEKDLRNTIVYCLGEGFLTGMQKEDGTEYFFNEDQRLDLLNWKVARERMSEAGKKGNEKRWNKGETTDEEQE